MVRISLIAIRERIHILPLLLFGVLPLATPFWIFASPEALKNLAAAFLFPLLFLVSLFVCALRKELPNIRSSAVLGGGAVVLLTLSSILAPSPYRFMGFAFEPGTLISFAIIALAFLSGYLQGSQRINAWSLALAVSCAVTGALYLYGSIAGLETLRHLAGNSLTVHVLAGVGFFGALSYALDSHIHTSRYLPAAIIALAVCAALIVESRSQALFVSVGAGALVIAAVSLYVQKERRGLSVAAVALAGLFLITGASGLVERVPQIFPPEAAEIRPSLQATGHAIALSYASDPQTLLIGGGPTAFRD
ncbi:hypothetical protein HY417_03450, partial [Candidatus Kaiserbacteria bacterium]|nr:hypothetical protein [Candidatus Kaiserbacteria bacterium]